MSTDIIKRPVMTEKATSLASKNIYAFVVAIKSSKVQIAQIIEKVYKVKVGTVRTVTRPGKTRRVGRMMKTVQMPNTKIAYIQLAEGKIDIFPQA